jgi:predicted acylesterase/phospholipase RssA
MPYPIEILTTDQELEESINQACITFNQVQHEFRFGIPSQMRDFFYPYRKKEYRSFEVFEWLNDYRSLARGHRPFIILVLTGHLSSEKFSNLFSTICADDGLAVFTTLDFNHFLFDQVRFCRYYMLRHAINFVAPALKSHIEPADPQCLFYFKSDKKKIRDSLDHGGLCDTCRAKLLPHLNNEIDTAINKLLQVVRNQHPYALVLKGGGVRGLAFAGALLELEKYYSFDTFAGTSAGAIAAVLLACQYRPGELMQILKEKNFKDFKDAAFPQNMFNFIFKGGFYPGNVLEKWIASLVADRTNKLNAARMKDLPYHAVVYAAMLKEGAITFDSRSHRSDTSVAFAARCSMSIPFYFIPRTIENLNVFDGGIRHNFPAQIFSTAYPDKPFIALYLDESRGQGKKTFWQKCRSVIWGAFRRIFSFIRKPAAMAGELLDIITSGEERDFVNQNHDKVVIIDPSPVRTTDFNLSQGKKELLILAGRLAALKFLAKNQPDANIDPSEIKAIDERVAELRATV